MAHPSSELTSSRSAVTHEPARRRSKPSITKRALIIGLLQRRKGASLVELTEATGWQPHSVRAALTGLRKQNVRIARTNAKQGGSVYRIVTETLS